MKEILIIRFSSIGDIVMALPVAHAIKEMYGKQCKVTWMTKKIYAGLVENNDSIDRIIYLEDYKNGYFRILKEIFRNYNKLLPKEKILGPFIIPLILKIVPAIKNLRKYKFDIILDMQGNIESSIIRMMCNAKSTIVPSFVINGTERFSLKIEDYKLSQHRIQDYLDVVRYLGYRSNSINFGWKFTIQEKNLFEEICISNGILKNMGYIVCCIGTTWESKNYPIEYWSQIIEYLYAKGLRVVIIGGEEEKAACLKLEGSIGSEKFLNLVGKTSLREMAIIIKNAKLIISGDSGPMHIAYSMDKDVIALMGPTNPIKWGPYGEKSKIILVDHNCRGCYKTVCPKGIKCLKSIVPDQVIMEINNTLLMND